jgi:hypothetical protein
MIKLLLDYGVDLDAQTPKGWTPLSYAKAKGKYGATEEKGIYPEVRLPPSARGIGICPDWRLPGWPRGGAGAQPL